MSKKEELFQLPERTVVVKFIPRQISLAPDADKSHVAYGGMLDNAIQRFYTPLQRNGSIKSVLTNDEKEHLEKITGLNLSIYSDYWSEKNVLLRKDDTGNQLHLNNPEDYISYKILLAYTKKSIAPSWADRNRLIDYKFALTEANEVTEVNNKSFNIKKDAFKAYAKYENNYGVLLNTLRLLANKPVSDNTAISTLQREISNYVDNEPAKFLSVVLDANFETKALLNEAVAQGIVNKTGNRYVTADGLELCNSGEIPIFTNAVAYLDAPKNQDVRSIIEAKLAKKKK